MKQLTKLKFNNFKLVLDTLKNHGSISKKQITSITNLSPVLITRICSELIEKKIVLEGEFLPSEKAGRREQILYLNYNFKYVIGLSFFSDSSKITISNLKPSLTYSKEYLNLDKTPEELIVMMLEELKEWMDKNNLKENDFLGIGVISKGTINRIENSIGIDIWGKELSIKKEIKKIFNLPVVVENDVKSFAVAHNYLYLNFPDFFLVHYSINGIGGAVLKNELLINEVDSIGKIGHVIIDPSKEFCPICKRRGCLESLVSLKTILKKASQYHDNLSISKLFELYDMGDIEISKLLNESAKYMAQSIINAYSIIGSKDIILHGDLFFNENYFFSLISYIKRYQLGDFYKKIILSPLKKEEIELAPNILAIDYLFFQNIDILEL
ncbi:ROK family protein [Cetobacterium sp. 8H]|uniref:ROK family protein n=1 Tax=Cetobacterium sp. 8H TaxID=2759681 RepID=UPI00163D1B4F|nr:ROK family protein [Cetobacterium sp. 8H]MBC2850126.1 ROK family protein [Cetobacterium sp. 8H]